MLRGLIIRQFFIVVDVALGVLAVGSAAFIAISLLQSPAEASIPVADTAADKVALRDPEARTEYDRIIDSGVFGAAGHFKASEPVPVEEPSDAASEELIETTLNLTLLGVMASGPTDESSSAIIQNKETNEPMKHYYVADAVADKVTLLEVYPRYVILENARGKEPKKETLSLFDEDELKVASNPAPAAAPAETADELPSSVYLNRQEMEEEINANYAELITKVKPEYVRDNSGNVIGLTANNISNIPLAQKLHLKDGDVLQSINNEAIDSEQKIYELFLKYQSAASFRVGILRNGQPSVVTYRVR